MWSNVSVLDDNELSELYALLTENYVEDDENMFRFDYSREFLKWFFFLLTLNISKIFIYDSIFILLTYYFFTVKSFNLEGYLIV